MEADNNEAVNAMPEYLEDFTVTNPGARWDLECPIAIVD